MGRSRKRRKASRRERAPKSGSKASSPTKKAGGLRGKVPFLVLGAVIAAAVGGYLLFGRGSEEKRATSPPRVAEKSNVSKSKPYLREKRETLSPDLFRGKVRAAYQIAKDIPEVLDKLYCYCRCRENFGHKSLLTCYVTRHAAG